MSWINFGGFRGGPAAVTHGHVSHDHNLTAASPNEATTHGASASVSNSGTGAELELQRTRDIKKNLIHCAELKKHNTRFYSEVLRKKFFVLYEDSRRSVTNPRDHTADLADSGAEPRPSEEEDEGYEPARLEYYNNQRNWEAGEQPRRVIILRDVFTITRKRDTRESIHKYVIAIYMVEDCLGIVFDTEEVMKTWLEMLISCQMGGRSIEGRIPKPKYDYVYVVDVQHFEPELPSNSFQMSGPYRMVVTSNDVKFFALGSNQPLCFLISSIRGCSISKANRRIFKLEIGRSSESGSGVLLMKCNDEEISDTIRETMYAVMRALIESNANSTASSRHRPRTSIPLNSNNIRIRTHSWSNMDKSKSFRAASSAKPITHHHHQHKSSTAAFLDRHRTTSEGNTQFDIKRSMRGGKSITSGSPMSPGSFVSSESAGSSNSLDENDDNRIVTPIDDHMGPATIFEESSAESCVEQTQHNSASSNYFKNPNPTESRLADSISIEPSSSLTSAASTMTPANQGTDINVNYTPIDILPSTSGYTITGTSSNLIASSPPGTSVHYSTILMDATQAASLLQTADNAPGGLPGGGNLGSKLLDSNQIDASSASKEENSSSYMIMSPQGTTPIVADAVSLNCNQKSKIANSSFSSNELLRHKPLSGLLADHDLESDVGTGSVSVSSVTSPISQSSYNPLLDELVHQASDDSAYMVMSPATSSGGGGSRMGTGSRKSSHHQRSGSNPINPSSSNSIPSHASAVSATSEDYVDMSPAGSGSRPGAVPIPNRNMSSTSLTFGTSPSAALTSHLVSFGDQSSPGGAGGGPLGNHKTPEDSPYLVMSPVDPEAKDFSLSRRSTPPVKQRTASIDSTSGSGSGTSLSISRQKTNTRGRFYRGQSDSQRSSLCFDDPCHWDLGISPQESSGGTLMGPPSEAGTEPLDYAPLDLTRARTISKAELDSLQPVAAVSRLRLDNEEPLDLDIADVEDGHGTTVNLVTNPRAYSVGCRPPSLLTGSSSSVSTTGSGSSHHHSRHKSRFVDIPGATTASGTSGTGTGSQASSFSPGTALLTGQSPSSMAARLTGWIRHRTGSVPSKSAISGRRRHRTQSEGEKDEI